MAIPETAKLLLPEWSAQIVTRDGLQLNVRPASPDDQEQVRDFLDSVSEADLRFRFLAAVRPSQFLAEALTRVDHSNVENLLAFDGQNGRLIATAMVAAATSPDTAEIAIVVRSDLKNKGIGWALLGHACDYATARGFRRAECIEWSENRMAVALEQEQGFTSRECPGDATLRILSKELAGAGGDARDTSDAAAWRLYSLCFLERGDSVADVQFLEAENDQNALELASSIKPWMTREIWDRHRLVRVLPPNR